MHYTVMSTSRDVTEKRKKSFYFLGSKRNFIFVIFKQIFCTQSFKLSGCLAVLLSDVLAQHLTVIVEKSLTKFNI